MADNSLRENISHETHTVCTHRIEGGELFERVIDDDFVLTEKSCTIFMRQICEGIQFIHQQHILHLDLKVRRRGTAASRAATHRRAS